MLNILGYYFAYVKSIMKKTQLLFKLLSSVAVTMLLSACGASMKPDHPQVYESFKDRRPPKENIFLEEGKAAPTHRKTNFRAYTGRTVDSKDQKYSDDQNSGLQDSRHRTDMNSVQGQPQQSSTTSQGAVNSSNNTNTRPSFWDRLKDKFSSLSTSASPEHTMVAARKVPIENEIQIAQIQEYHVAQGSTNSYSYYDSADEIVPASPVYSIKEEKLASIMLLAANTNSSAPLVDVPEPESYKALKNEAKLAGKPDLRSVPQASKKECEKVETKAAKLSMGKPMQAEDATMLNQPELDQDDNFVNESAQPVAESAYTIQDTKAEIVYQGGQKLVMGSIGMLKTRMVN